ncbi:LysR substrate-binding domain-containing protein [Aureimonas ureilytica]|uniref:LysR substrate-binding domain-containing protein n=1 Tax=Aureimonas ureilytica TaxID=401562 RepID=UPI00036AD5E4|nr:LysR substrate-binding domain-containing protein [Aureimonas ureilytica]
MARHLPPLAALRAFEAAARHLSFTRAAEELGMTQAAVSYQIKVLEERVGTPLFLRGRRQIALTAEGARFAAECTSSFERLSAAYDDLRGSAAGMLSISSVPTFATYWLARHLGSFQLEHPETAVQLTSTRHVTDFEREPVDIAIRAGTGSWPGLTAHLLVAVDYTPMLSPDLANRFGGLPKSATELLRFPLVNTTHEWWDLWFSMMGITQQGIDRRSGPTLGSQDLEAVAALAGQGASLLTPFFYADEIAAGRLVQPFRELYPIGRGYYLVYPTARRTVPKIRAFRDWLLSHFPTADGDLSSAEGIG